MWLLRQGHVTAHISLFVTALIGTGVSLLGSGNHENTKNYMETFWGTVVERAQSEKGHSITLQAKENGGERGTPPWKEGSNLTQRRMVFLLLAQERSGGRKHNTTDLPELCKYDVVIL